MDAIDAGSVIIRLIADAKGVIAGVNQGAGAIRGFSATAKSIAGGMVSTGKTMSKWITLPFLALVAAAAKFSLDFEKSMTNVEALVGMTAEQVARAKREILTLAGEVGRSPRELGEAYYFIASSGLKGAAAMRALRASALASAAGLGQTKVIADAVTSALNAYGEANLSATKATDILLAAVREGKSEPEEFAGSIGRVIPIAQKMGVSFGEVAGMMAAMSLNGTNADEAVTQITAALSAAIKPTKQGQEALASVDMTYASLRKNIAEKGLVETFDLLDEAFKGNVESLGAVFGNVRALRAIMTLTGPSMEKYMRIVRDVSAASGDAAKAAEIALSKPGAKIEKAWAKIQASLIKAGDIVVPILADIAETAGKVVDAFGELPQGTQKFVIGAGAVAAAAGPAAVAIGKLGLAVLSYKAAAAGSAGTAVGSGAASASAAAAFTGLVGLVPAAAISAAIATAIVLGVKEGMEEAKSVQQEGGSGWEQFVQGMWAGIKAPGEWFSEKTHNEALNRRDASRISAIEQLAKDAKNAWGVALDRIKYMQADIWQAAQTADKAGAFAPDFEATHASLLKVRDAIARDLKVPLQEASQLTKRLFPSDWAAKIAIGGKPAHKTMAQLSDEIGALQKKFRRQLVWGDLVGSDKTKRKIQKLQGEYDTMRRKADRAAREMAEVGSIVATGMDRSGKKVKISAGHIVKFMQIPFGKAGQELLAAGSSASAKYAAGVSKGKGKAQSSGKGVATAAVKQMQAAVSQASGYGSNVGSAFSSSLAAQESAAYAAGFKVGQAGAKGVKAGGEVNSPSRAGIYAGRMMGAGLVVGLDQSIPSVRASATGLGALAVSSLSGQPSFGVGAQTGTQSPASRGESADPEPAFVFENCVFNGSPPEDWLEAARKHANKVNSSKARVRDRTLGLVST